MTNVETSRDATWAPSSCTLPTVEKPLRQNQFDDLIADAVIAVRRIDPATIQLTLRWDPQLTARAAELSVRESECCSFFSFALSIGAGTVMLTVSVPLAQSEVLDALADRAQAVSTIRAGA